MYSLNKAQLIAAIAIMVIVWDYKDSFDWLHFGYMLHIVGVSMWQTIFTAVAIPQYYWKRPEIGLGALASVVIMAHLEFVYQAKFFETVDALPKCYDEHAIEVFRACVRGAIKIYAVLLFFLVLTALLNMCTPKTNTKSRWSWTLRLSSWPIWGIVLFILGPLVGLLLELV